MLLKIQLFLLSLIAVDGNKHHTKGPMVMKLDTEQIIDALTSKVTSRYIDKLAQEFAKKAAKHFIDQIRKREREIAVESKFQVKAKKVQDRSKKKVLEENEAMALVDEPPPDGDNFYQLSDDELEAKKKIVPVIGLTKVNGKYFYRRLI